MNTNENTQKTRYSFASISFVLLVSLSVASPILWFFQVFMLINEQPFRSDQYQLISVIICVVGIILSAFTIASKSRKINRNSFIKMWIFAGLAISFLPALLFFSNSIYLMFALSGVIGVFFGLGAPVLLGYFALATKNNNRSTISGIAFLIIVVFFNFFLAISSLLLKLIILFSLMLIAIFSFRSIRTEIFSPNEDLPWKKIPADKPFLFYLLSMLMLMIGIFIVMPSSLVFASQDSDVVFFIAAISAGGSAIIGGIAGDLFGRKKLLLIGFLLVAVSYGILSIFSFSVLSFYSYLVVYYASEGILYPIFIFALWGDMSQKKSPEKYYVLGCLPFIMAVVLGYSIGTNIVDFLSPATLSSLVSIFLFAAILPIAYAAEVLPSRNTIKELKAERQRFLNILENIPTMVCLITKDYQVAFANRLFREKFGSSEGKQCYKWYSNRDKPCDCCEPFKVLKTGKAHNWVSNTRNGLVIEAYGYPFTDVDGSIMVLEVNFDMTEQKNLQKQLQEKERLAAIGTTASMVGHDIRNPLQSIMCDTYLLKEELAAMSESTNKEGFAESISNIEKNVSYINKIVADLQDYSRAIIPNLSNVNFYDIVQGILKSVKIPDDIKVSIIPQSKISLKADPHLLTRMLTNLVTNAIQAMPKGGKLEIGGFKKDDFIQITVSDTGNGIPKEVQAKLFTPMITTKAKGQGLGLAVVKRLAEASNGKVSFETVENQGTKFTIELPIIADM